LPSINDHPIPAFLTTEGRKNPSDLSLANPRLPGVQSSGHSVLKGHGFQPCRYIRQHAASAAEGPPFISPLSDPETHGIPHKEIHMRGSGWQPAKQALPGWPLLS